MKEIYELNDFTRYECESNFCKFIKNQPMSKYNENDPITIANNETCDPMKPLFLNIDEDRGLFLSYCRMKWNRLPTSKQDEYILQAENGLFFRSDLHATSDMNLASHIKFLGPQDIFGPNKKINLYRTDPFSPWLPEGNDRVIRFNYPPCAGSNQKIFNFVVCKVEDTRIGCLTQFKDEC